MQKIEKIYGMTIAFPNAETSPFAEDSDRPRQDQNHASNPHDDPVLPDGFLPDNLINIPGNIKWIEEDVPFGFIQFIGKDQKGKSDNHHDHRSGIAVPHHGG